MANNGKFSRDESDDKTVLRIDFSVFLKEHFDAGVNQEGSENENDPMEPMDQFSAYQDHHYAHDQRSQHAPKQYAVLVLGRDFEVRKDQDKDEEVVNLPQVAAVARVI